MKKLFLLGLLLLTHVCFADETHNEASTNYSAAFAGKGIFPQINAPTNTGIFPPSQLRAALNTGCTNTAGRQGSITLVYALDDTAGGGQPRTDITRGDPGSSTNTEVLSWPPLALGASSTNRMVWDSVSPNGFVQIANTNLFRVISWRFR